MTFVNTEENKTPLILQGDYELDFFNLIQLLDNPKVKISDADPTEAEVGKVVYFIRTVSGNKVACVKNEYLIPCPTEDFNPEITLNDFVLLSGRNVLIETFSKTDSKEMVFNAFPIPFGIYHDSDSNSNVVVMQLCVKETYFSEEEEVKFIPVEQAALPDFIKEHFKCTKD